MFATVKILFMKDSTEGVADGQVTASAGTKESATVVSMEHPKQKADGTYGVVAVRKNQKQDEINRKWLGLWGVWAVIFDMWGEINYDA